MAVTPSTMLPLGTKVPSFSLPDTKGKVVSVDDFKNARALLVIFMCNHCPYVKHVHEGVLKLIKDYQAKGVAVVAISSNDIAAYPEDGPAAMARQAERFEYTFPYLYDESQEVARAFQAACTPDFYVFDRRRELVYRGQMDNSRPGNAIPVTGKDLRAALDAVLGGREVSFDQKPSIGCNIKWKPGREPSYFHAHAAA